MKEKYPVTCRECGLIFYVAPYELRRNRKYCSQDCHRAFNKVRVEDDVSYIELTTQKREFVAETIVDTADVFAIREAAGRVFALWDQGTKQYKAMMSVEPHKVLLHRFLTDAPADLEVDHINWNTLDNRRANLRTVTSAQNNQNRSGAMCDSRSGVRNVRWLGWLGKYNVRITVNGHAYDVGYFATLEEADEAAIAARRKFMTHSER